MSHKLKIQANSEIVFQIVIYLIDFSLAPSSNSGP